MNLLMVPENINKKPEAKKLLCRIIRMNEAQSQAKMIDLEIQRTPYQYLTIHKDVDLTVWGKIFRAG